MITTLLGGLGVAGFGTPGFFLTDGTDGRVVEATAPGNAAGGGKSRLNGSPPPGDVGAPPIDRGPGEGEEFVERFLRAVNGGDAAAARALMCPDAIGADIDSAISGRAQLRIDRSNAVVGAAFVGVDLIGTVNGAPVRAGRFAGFVEEGRWCAYSFYVIS